MIYYIVYDNCEFKVAIDDERYDAHQNWNILADKPLDVGIMQHLQKCKKPSVIAIETELSISDIAELSYEDVSKYGVKVL